MKIIIADPFAPMRGPSPTPIPSPTNPTPVQPKIEKKWFIERRDELRSSRPPPFFAPMPMARIDDPIADDWFR